MAFSIERKHTRRISVGSVDIGGTAPIAVQSMTNTFTQNVDETVSQIDRLEKAGCEIVRVAVPDMVSAEAVGSIKAQISIPIIADIHFDYRLAVKAIQSGADGVRINPGNIGGWERLRPVLDAAMDRGTAIRIGVNAGSLEKDLAEKHNGPTAEAMVESALRQIDAFEAHGCRNVKLSIKASDVARTVEAYRMLSAQTDLPLHIGVTEAGGLYSGTVKSTLGIGMLLSEGIGDTLRVSLTRDPAEEVRVAYEILRALGIRRRGVEIISCPTCGRCRIDLFSIAEQIENELLYVDIPIKVAIMGCVVNGPGEAKEADLGIAGGDGIGVLFRKGEVIKKVPQKELAALLLEEIKGYKRAE